MISNFIYRNELDMIYFMWSYEKMKKYISLSFCSNNIMSKSINIPQVSKVTQVSKATQINKNRGKIKIKTLSL